MNDTDIDTGLKLSAKIEDIVAAIDKKVRSITAEENLDDAGMVGFLLKVKRDLETDRRGTPGRDEIDYPTLYATMYDVLSRITRDDATTERYHVGRFDQYADIMLESNPAMAAQIKNYWHGNDDTQATR